MKITSNSKEYLIVDDLYDEVEMNNIWKELDFLTHPNKMLPPEKSGAATSISGEILKKNSAIFLDDFYTKREHSNILTYYRKIYKDDIFDEFEKMNNDFKYASITNADRTFLSYYENSDYYKPHTDTAVITYLYWCHKSPKGFEGGNLYLSDIDAEIEYKNNRLVVFPSYYMHSVSPVKMLNDTRLPFSTFGRYCITTFSYIGI